MSLEKYVSISYLEPLSGKAPLIAGWHKTTLGIHSFSKERQLFVLVGNYTQNKGGVQKNENKTTICFEILFVSIFRGRGYARMVECLASSYRTMSSIPNASRTATIILTSNKHGKWKGRKPVHVKKEKIEWAEWQELFKISPNLVFCRSDQKIY